MGTFVPAKARQVNQTGPFVSEEPHDWQFSPDAGMLRLAEHRTDLGRFYWTGDFVDYRGIVSVQRKANYTRLDTVYGGYCHTRSYRKYFGDRTIAQLCRQFLSELHGAPEPLK